MISFCILSKRLHLKCKGLSETGVVSIAKKEDGTIKSLKPTSDE